MITNHILFVCVEVLRPSQQLKSHKSYANVLILYRYHTKCWKSYFDFGLTKNSNYAELFSSIATEKAPFVYVAVVSDQNCYVCLRDYGTYHIDEHRRIRRCCPTAQSRQSLRCSHTYSMEVYEESDQKSDI